LFRDRIKRGHKVKRLFSRTGQQKKKFGQR